MYSDKRLSDIFELEAFLFGGVPETAEQMHEREFHSYSEPRLTRRELATCEPQQPADEPRGAIVCRIQIDMQTGDVTTIPLESHTDETTASDRLPADE